MDTVEADKNAVTQSGEQHTAKVFMSGNSQAVRLPKAFRFAADIDTLEIQKVGDSLVLTPKKLTNNVWDEFAQGLAGFEPNFADCFDDREKENQIADMAEATRNAALNNLFSDSSNK